MKSWVFFFFFYGVAKARLAARRKTKNTAPKARGFTSILQDTPTGNAPGRSAAGRNSVP
jgi:hypothetical protein